MLHENGIAKLLRQVKHTLLSYTPNHYHLHLHGYSFNDGHVGDGGHVLLPPQVHFKGRLERRFVEAREGSPRVRRLELRDAHRPEAEK